MLPVSLDVILVVDDDPAIAAAVHAALGDAGRTVVQACSAGESLRLAGELRPDVVVLDLGSPDDDGGEVCRRLRPLMEGPIIVLSARTDLTEQVRLRELGADDFLTKPFSLRELDVRVHAHARRMALSQQIDTNRTVTLDGVELDLRRSAAVRNGQPIGLSRVEWCIVRALAAHAGQVRTHRQILAHMWEAGFDNRHELLCFHVTNLRRKIERHPANPRIVVTEPGVGYRLQLDPDR
jgi:two-component system KDP operon response regulator KdpE